MAQHDINTEKEVSGKPFSSKTLIQTFHDEYDDDPLLQFTYALRAPETRRQYPRRLKVFMDFIEIEVEWG